MSCPQSVNTAIDEAIYALQQLKILLAAGTPPWNGWHTNPIDGTLIYLRTNQINTEDGDGTAITFKADPSTSPETIHSVTVEFSPY